MARFARLKVLNTMIGTVWCPSSTIQTWRWPAGGRQGCLAGGCAPVGVHQPRRHAWEVSPKLVSTAPANCPR